MKLLFGFLLFAVSGLRAQSLTEELNVAWQRFIQEEELRHASFSLTVVDNTTGKLVFGKNEELGLAPASTLKVLTSAMAFDVLGEDFRFQTRLTYTGEIINGELKGDLIIRGSGDPTLGSSRFANCSKSFILQQWLYALKSAGIKKIEGTIIADDAVWDSQNLPQGWIWQDMGNYYGASSNVLCWGENELEVHFSPATTTGAQATLRPDKNYPFLNIINEVKTGPAGSGDGVYAYSSPYSNTIWARGTYAKDLKKTIRFSLPDAAMALAYDLSATLSVHGIANKGFSTSRAKDINPAKERTLFTCYSPPLSEIIEQFNHKSINLYGEQLLRVLAADPSASIENSLKFVQQFWDDKGIEKYSLNIGDGSGLSPANRVTGKAMATVLYWAKRQPWFEKYYQSLPVYNDMRMKSGTIADVLAYAGYQGNYSFSIMVNNYIGSTTSMRSKIFTLLNQLK